VHCAIDKRTGVPLPPLTAQQRSVPGLPLITGLILIVESNISSGDCYEFNQITCNRQDPSHTRDPSPFYSH
jgi:hypothetical protein